MKSLVMSILLLPMFIYAQEGIRFEDLSWKQVLQKAKKENKYIFVDCYATWCGPCKVMDKKVYLNDTIGRYFNGEFVSVKIQMDTSKSDDDFIKGWYAEASKIKSHYQIGAFPTYLFFSPSGDIVHRDVGFKKVEDFMTVGAEALNSEKQYYTLLKKYQRSKLDTAYMKPLAKMVLRIEGKSGEALACKIANDYINRLSTDALFTKDNIKLMYDFTKNSKGRGFKIFRDHGKRITETDERFTEGACKAIVLRIINNEEIKPYTATKNGKPDWEKIKSNIKKYGSLGEEALTLYKPGIIFKTEIEPELKMNSEWSRILSLIEKQNLGRNAEFVVGSTVIYYLNGVSFYHTEKNCKNLVAAATFYADSFSTSLKANALNTWAWTLFQCSIDEDELMSALAWSKRSIGLEPGMPEYLDTYANLLYKLGRIQEAIVWQEKAVQIEKDRAKKNNRASSNSIFQQTLIKMQKSEKTWPEK